MRRPAIAQILLQRNPGAASLLLSRRRSTGGSRLALFESKFRPIDLLRAIGGVVNVRHNTRWKESAVHMVDLSLRGSTEMNVEGWIAIRSSHHR
jgi:hypothetical protein